MKILDPKAAADEIHQAVNVALATDHPSPEDRHSVDFITKVCEHLGVDPTPHNLTLVGRELTRAGIVPHIMQDYPKAVGRRVRADAAGNPVLDEYNRPYMDDVIVHNEDEEKAWSKETQPVLGADGKPLLDAKGAERTHEVMVRKDDTPATVAPVHVIGGPYPKLVGQRQLFGADGKPLRDQFGHARMSDIIVANEDDEKAYVESCKPADAPVEAAEVHHDTSDDEAAADARHDADIKAQRAAEDAARNASRRNPVHA